MAQGKNKQFQVVFLQNYITKPFKINTPVKYNIMKHQPDTTVLYERHPYSDSNFRALHEVYFDFNTNYRRVEKHKETYLYTSTSYCPSTKFPNAFICITRKILSTSK